MSRTKIKTYTTMEFEKLIKCLKDKYPSLYYIYSYSNQTYKPINYANQTYVPVNCSLPYITFAVFRDMLVSRIIPQSPRLVLFNSFKEFDIPSGISFYKPLSISVETKLETGTEYRAYFDVAVINTEDADNPIEYTIIAKTEPYNGDTDQFVQRRKTRRKSTDISK